MADKRKQRSLPPGFFDESPRGSGSAEGRVPATRRRGTGLAIPVADNVEQASPRTPGRKRRPLSKIWRRIPRPRSHKARSTGSVSEPSTRKSRSSSLSKMWKRIRHPRSHQVRSLELVDVPQAQGNPRNYSAREVRMKKEREKKKEKARAAKDASASSTQRATTSGASTTPAASATSANNTSMTSPPNVMIAQAGCWTRFWLFICCASTQYTDGHH